MKRYEYHKRRFLTKAEYAELFSIFKQVLQETGETPIEWLNKRSNKKYEPFKELAEKYGRSNAALAFHLTRLIEPDKFPPFNDDENQLIEDFVSVYGTQWKKLEHVLAAPGYVIRERYLRYTAKKKSNFKKLGYFTVNEINELNTIFHDLYPDGVNFKKVSWAEVGRRHSTRSANQIRLWARNRYLTTELRRRPWTLKDDLFLTEYLKDRDFREYAEVDWDVLSQKMDLPQEIITRRFRSLAFKFYGYYSMIKHSSVSLDDENEAMFIDELGKKKKRKKKKSSEESDESFDDSSDESSSSESSDEESSHRSDKTASSSSSSSSFSDDDDNEKKHHSHKGTYTYVEYSLGGKEWKDIINSIYEGVRKKDYIMVGMHPCMTTATGTDGTNESTKLRRQKKGEDILMPARIGDEELNMFENLFKGKSEEERKKDEEERERERKASKRTRAEAGLADLKGEEGKRFVEGEEEEDEEEIDEEKKLKKIQKKEMKKKKKKVKKLMKEMKKKNREKIKNFEREREERAAKFMSNEGWKEMADEAMQKAEHKKTKKEKEGDEKKERKGKKGGDLVDQKWIDEKRMNWMKEMTLKKREEREKLQGEVASPSRMSVMQRMMMGLDGDDEEEEEDTDGEKVEKKKKQKDESESESESEDEDENESEEEEEDDDDEDDDDVVEIKAHKKSGKSK
ncbi:uncharacterized protein MONOS_1284 [Monocercomonoides exilis]|uniref:uncharacterized protein n=1 Tax=Monocercomonoides exilis TaxID=2049356 RepID=UPI0035593D98|nr:hypothetical protein MONOS_1284 [Monocercomonoides exilis]|eukprot:MONOS_1284.1-p1 / transcript=MONOS_1284.1 / gene=MONOS_1284 / organism=Monocercomonoides_exilis_PA203 / gene_product=unspecified product / transcript_product=unspecified product / location=Mono_scaffold00022:47801-50306(-) / protein_length=682 / sequence_SO=supercontig / SO=protein_coding / is_pseudo=false